MGRRRKPAHGRLHAALAVVCVLVWAWETHPIGLAVSAILAAAVLFAGWRVRDEWRQRNGERTDLYQHWFRADLVADLVAAGCPPGWFGYTGISNAYPLRCAQHAEASWWWVLVDPARSTRQTWPTREAAERAEAATIRRLCGVGNQQHNPAWDEQTAVREELRAFALRLRAQLERTG